MKKKIFAFITAAVLGTQLLTGCGSSGKNKDDDKVITLSVCNIKAYIFLERMADFILEFRYGIPRRFYTVLDSSYAVGMSKFLVNELGILPSGVFISDNTPERWQKTVAEELENISEYRSVTPVFETDGEKILLEIDKDDHRNRFIILGSAWESHYAKQHDADLLILNVPLTYRLALNCAYIGYNGGLRVIEEIYNGVLETYRS